MLRALDLFSGIGGISVALQDYARTIGYVEIDKYAQSVLLSRMLSGDIETAPIFRDITRLDGTKLRGSIDLICGGFPCQDLSVAGKGKGLAGERSGLFFEIIRLVKEIKPSFVFLENVPAIRTRGLSEVVNAFTEIGYDCRWTCLSASYVGANHKRERWFLLGYSKHNGQLAAEKPRSDAENDKKESTREIGSSESKRASQYRDVSRDFSNLADSWSERFKAREARELGEADGEKKGSRNKSTFTLECCGSKMADSNGIGLERPKHERIGKCINEQFSNSGKKILADSNSIGTQIQAQRRVTTVEKSGGISKDGWFTSDFWAIEPDVGRVVNGLPHRVDRIKCLGNSVVPLQVKTAFERLIGYASI